MTTIKNTREAIAEYLDNLDNSQLIEIHTQYCENINATDDMIYNNDEDFINEMIGDAWSAVCRAVYGDYNPNHDYVSFDGYGNLKSSNYPNDLMSTYDIITDIIDNPENYDIELEQE